jgi:hypothetical protein
MSNKFNYHKFDSLLQSEFSRHMDVINQVADLCDEMGRLLSENYGKEDFIDAVLQFAKISVETPMCIINSLKTGHLAHAHILLRWYLELAHLILYLWKDPQAYNDWKLGKQIRPRKIGEFFDSIGFATWKESYEEWSKVVHCKYEIVDNYHNIASRTPTNEVQSLILGQALRNTMFISHKCNYVFGKILQPHIGNEYQKIALKYNELEDEIFQLSDEQNRNECKFMGNDNDDNNKIVG